MKLGFRISNCISCAVIVSVLSFFGLSHAQNAHMAPPLQKVADVPMPGSAVRFDYQSMDSGSGRLYIAHMNAGTNVFEEFDETNLAPSFNVAPQSFQPVVRLRPETGERKLIQLSRWWSGGLSGLRSDRRTLECDEEFAGHRQKEIVRLP